MRVFDFFEKVFKSLDNRISVTKLMNELPSVQDEHMCVCELCQCEGYSPEVKASKAFGPPTDL